MEAINHVRRVSGTSLFSRDVSIQFQMNAYRHMYLENMLTAAELAECARQFKVAAAKEQES